MFDCDVEPQLTSGDALYSAILWVYSLDSFFGVPVVGSDHPFSAYIGFHGNIGLIS